MEHIDEEHGPWSFHTCKFVPYKSNSDYAIYRHEAHRKESEFETFICNSKPPETYQCKFCEFETDLKVKLSEHFHVHEGCRNNIPKTITKCYLCENCDFATYSLLVFARHAPNNCTTRPGCDSEQLEHNHKWYEYQWGGSSWFRCRHCFHETLYKHVIECHVKTHTNEQCANEKKEVQKRIERVGCFICRDCKFRTASLVEITKHFHNCNFKKVVRTAINDDKWYKSKSGDTTWLKCKFCAFQTAERYIIRKHIINSHGNLKTVKWFKCDHCSHKTDDHSSLKTHVLAKHTNPEDVKWHKCEQCSYKSRWPSGVKKHVLVVHTDPDKLVWFKCEHCVFKGKTKDYLQIHIKRKHVLGGDARDFKCEHCSWAFKYKAGLNKHMRTKHVDNNNDESNAI